MTGFFRIREVVILLKVFAIPRLQTAISQPLFLLVLKHIKTPASFLK